MSTWRDKSGRKSGKDSYQFGDIFRSTVHFIASEVGGASKRTKEEGAKKRHGGAAQSGGRGKANVDANQRDIFEQRAIIESELDTFHEESSHGTDAPTSPTPQLLTVPVVKAVSLVGCCFPDPDPIVSSISREVSIDNVTRLSKATVDRICYVRNVHDIQTVLEYARATDRKVSMRGTKHSMGGQTMPSGSNGFVIDMSRMNSISNIDQINMSVVVGAGATWSDLIFELNKFGLSPRTMQSYSSFSIGGAVSVCAHGITSDYSMVESVISLELVKFDGSIVHCEHGVDGESGELFSLCIGGYGMYGVISTIKLKIVPNTQMAMEMMTVRGIDEFLPIYQGVHQADDVEVRLGRIDLSTWNDFQLFAFRRVSRYGVRVVSQLPLHAKEMSKTSQLLYKWVMPSAYALRKAIEEATGSPIELSAGLSERNSLMYESAEPLVRLYSPLYEVDDTFVLQEYFLPPSSFKSWIFGAKQCLMKPFSHITLLNCTIRYVECDNTTTLSYSRNKEGSFAFVLYYRLRRTAAGDEELRQIQQTLISITLDLNGTFYLPYRHHYTHEQMKQAYPKIDHFFQRKLFYDPTMLFESSWSEHYGSPYVGSASSSPPLNRSAISWPKFDVVEGYSPRKVSEFRGDSFRNLMRDPDLRQKAFDGFLVKVLNIESPMTISRVVATAVWNVDNKTDSDIYDSIKTQLESSSGPLAKISNGWKSIKQLHQQRKEFTRELAAILSRIGRLGVTHDMVCVGEGGKMVLTLRETIGIRGRIYCVDESFRTDLSAVLLRGQVEPVGEHVFIDLQYADKIRISDSSADIVTMMGGLHHLPQEAIMPFLSEVKRILRPGGLFVTREHDASEALIPLLDVAHSLFNIMTGENLAYEKKERKAFRSILEWREIIQAAGLADVMMYEVQYDDPTVDEMLVFVNGSLEDYDSSRILAPSDDVIISPPAVLSPMESMMSNVPNALLEFGKYCIVELIKGLENVHSGLADALSHILSEGQMFAFKSLVLPQVGPVIELLKGILPMCENIRIAPGDGDIIPRELFIVINALITKAKSGDASPPELFLASIIMDVQKHFAPLNKESDRRNPQTSLDQPRNAVNREDAIKLFSRVLTAFPILSNLQGLEGVGFTKRAQLFVESKLGGRTITAEGIADAVIPYIDDRAWAEMVQPLEEILLEPSRYPFSSESIQNEDSIWWHVLMGFLASSKLKPNNYVLTAASWIGFGFLVEMWQVAQTSRGRRALPDSSDTPKQAVLQAKASSMLKKAVELVHTNPSDESYKMLRRCLADIGVCDYSGRVDEWTFFRGPEWMQVQIIQDFGNFIVNEPWFRFPFGQVYTAYLECLWKTTVVVNEKKDFMTAYTSWPFIVNAVPAVVMAIIGSQLALLATPCKMALGNEYTQEQNDSLFMELSVLVSRGASEVSEIINWTELDSSIKDVVEIIESKLYTLKVPAMFHITKTILNLAKDDKLRILTVQSHDTIQIRVALESDDLISKVIDRIQGVEIAYKLPMPTVDGGPHMPKTLNLYLSVEVPYLLDTIRVLKMTSGVRIIQIFCFWT